MPTEASPADGQARRPRITAVVNTLNEEANIENCLASLLPWVDEVLVVDMTSDDRTAELAHARGATVSTIPRSTHVEAARAVAIDLVDNGWVLVMDADEMVPVTLGRRLCEISASGEGGAVDIPRRNYMLGVEARYAGWELESDSHVRFFRKGAVTWGERIHGQPFIDPGTTLLHLPRIADMAIVHLNYVDLAHFVGKMDRYTTVEAAQQAGQISFLRMTKRCLAEFYSRYVRRQGWKGGWRGFSLSVLMMVYQFLVWAKSKELLETGGPAAVRERYGDIASEVAAEWRCASHDRQGQQSAV